MGLQFEQECRLLQTRGDVYKYSQQACTISKIGSSLRYGEKIQGGGQAAGGTIAQNP